MTSDNDSSQLVIEKVIGESGFGVLNTENILVVDPVVPVEDLVSKVESLVKEGYLEDALALIRVLKNPALFLMRGMLSGIKDSFTTESVETKIRADMEKRAIMKEGIDSIKKAYRTYTELTTSFTAKQKIDMARDRISVWIVNRKDLEDDLKANRHAVLVSKYIPSYKIEYMDDCCKGTWKFPECVIGTYATLVGAQGAQQKKVDLSSVKVVYPQRYKHPFVHTGSNSGKICLGSQFSEAWKDKVGSMRLYKAITYLLASAEQVIAGGYNADSSDIAPANGHIYENKYSRYKISDEVSEEYLKTYEEVRKKAEG